MVVLDGNFVLGWGSGTDYPSIHIFQCTLERTDVITNEVLEQITFIIAKHTVNTLGNMTAIYINPYISKNFNYLYLKLSRVYPI